MAFAGYATLMMMTRPVGGAKGIGLGVVRLSVHVYVLACIWLEAFCDLLAVDL